MNVLHSNDLTGLAAATWHDHVAARIAAMAFKPVGSAHFDATLCDGELGPLRVARLSTSATVIERDATHVGRGTPFYLLFLQRRGSGEIAHYGNAVTLAEGDMVLCDGAAPFKLTFRDAAEMLVLRIAATTLKEHLPSPECLCGRALREGEGVTATAATMAVSLFEQLAAGLSLQYQERVARHLLDVVATAYALAFHTPDSRSAIVSGRCATVKLFIEQHLRDPELSPCSIAARLKLSSRYLRMIFASENETVSAYILRRRLEQCARQIADPAWRGHSMTEIAFGWGFNSAPHFTRTFRDRFDMAPRDYRRLKLDAETTPFRRAASVGRMRDAQAA